MGTDYGVEMELAKLNTSLHQRYRNCVSVSQRMLTRYKNYFPYFTDHTFLHTMNILDFCNQLIGEQLSLLSEDDMYVLMMGALFHDVGMGVSISDFEEFCGELGIIVPKEQEERASVIRVNHQEFSGLFLKNTGKCLMYQMQTMLMQSSKCAVDTERRIYWMKRNIRENMR